MLCYDDINVIMIAELVCKGYISATWALYKPSLYPLTHNILVLLA